MLTEVFLASTASTALLIAEEIQIKYKMLSWTRSMSLSRTLALTKACKSEKSGLQNQQLRINRQIQYTNHETRKGKLTLDRYLPKKLSKLFVIFTMIKRKAWIMSNYMDQEYHYVRRVISNRYSLCWRVLAKSSFFTIILDEFFHKLQWLQKKVAAKNIRKRLKNKTVIRYK